MPDKKRIIVGISGASGVRIGVSLLETLGAYRDWETHLVVSDGARRTLELEMPGCSFDRLTGLAAKVYDFHDISASIASGTYVTEGMIIAPCSMKTVAGVASGYSDNLLLRAADVVLKERRKLVLGVRESPLSTIHLRNMLELSSMGAIIMPPLLTFYNNPENIDDMLLHVTAKLVSPFGLEPAGFKRWGEERV